MINKIVESPDRAVSKIKDGDTILIAGFQGVGHPHDLMQAVIRAGVKNLTVVANTLNLAMPLIVEKRIKKFICTLPKTNLDLGDMEIEVIPQANMIERVRAASAGIGGFYTPVGAETDYSIGKETRIIDGRVHVYEPAILADFAFVNAKYADRFGNLVYQRSGRAASHYMACAAKYTIVQAEEIKELGQLGPDQIHTPGAFVGCVCKVVNARRGRPKHAPTTEEFALGKRIAADIPDGSIVELGFGLPWTATDFLQDGKEVLVHSEGLIGPATVVSDAELDTSWRGADGRILEMARGSASMDFVDSFNLITSGKVDYAVLGAFQVGANGDFAGWATDDPSRLPAPGASMELAIHSRNVFIAMRHLDKDGKSKILPACTYPVTARGVVKRIYTDLATLEVTPNGLKVIDILNGMSHNSLEEVTGFKLIPKYETTN